jgi:hypothetical protein
MTRTHEIHAERMRNRPKSQPRAIPPPRVRAIIQSAAQRYGIEARFIRDGRQRGQLACAARREIARQLHALGFSTSLIGYWLGGLNHTSVVRMLKYFPNTKRRGPQTEFGAVDYTAWDEWAI